jgi:hypothetical protein
MASTTIKGTYALDPETVKLLERMARRWGVSKSEALRRAIRAAAVDGAGPSDALTALDRLQRAVGIDVTRAAEWSASARAERRATARRAARHR